MSNKSPRLRRKNRIRWNIVEIFECLHKKYDIIYRHYISDGDSKAFHMLLHCDPYDPEYSIF